MSNPDRRTAIKQLLGAAGSLAVAPTFRGQVDGDTMTGNYDVMGKEGEFHVESTASK
jgi:hypothetical protein